MKTKDFYFDLPSELIAQLPSQQRTSSKLLTYSTLKKQIGHQVFNNLPDLLNADDVLIMNDSRVIPARLYGAKSSGGKVELLVERCESEVTFWAHIKASRSPKIGSQICLNDNYTIIINDIKDGLFLCEANHPIDDIMDTMGHIPLPPYIQREDKALDKTRYQTVYARHKGSVAAPTAGLHFDESLLLRLQEKGVQIGFVTLHVGAGTFQPVRVEDIAQHTMHREYYTISETLANTVNKAKKEGRRVIAVGTTSLRSLESAAVNGQLVPGAKDTNIFITPGFDFQICDGLITNFHLPESTLMMLVSAFIGYETTMQIYAQAIKDQYRFFSYGDACLFL